MCDKSFTQKLGLTAYNTYPVILVSSYGCELSLRENDCFEVLGDVGVFARGVDVDHVKSRLVSMHRVENHLKWGEIYHPILAGPFKSSATQITQL